jgi:hypothetical protein
MVTDIERGPVLLWPSCSAWPISAVLSCLFYSGYPVLTSYSGYPALTILFWLSCLDYPSMFSCPILLHPSCPIRLAIMSWLSFPGSSVPTVLTQLLVPGCSFPYVLSRLSCLGCPGQACPFVALLFKLSRFLHGIPRLLDLDIRKKLTHILSLWRTQLYWISGWLMLLNSIQILPEIAASIIHFRKAKINHSSA